ncbi:hypothetical protein LQ953_14960 [Sphingomonas sp. IC-56]|uniref:hypothetical protein n=1 Tax=Sphingomonas sp. IC-56 TaxID=2898529 RepID=UPI001E52F1A9|nr:hypothetical protein [Sphingomonas sp. IC-56]MCD2325320.1 hypothetical protein [Sphingomonas sp. IC-56]
MPQTAPDSIHVLWPDEKNYARFNEVCGGTLLPSAEAYKAAADPQLKAFEAQGIKVERLEFDPEELLAFAKGAKSTAISA